MPRTQRRRPRYAGFLLTGAAIGLFADIVLVLGRGADSPSPSQLFFFLGLLLVGTGALLGGLVAVLIEGRPPRPEARDDASRTTTDP